MTESKHTPGLVMKNHPEHPDRPYILADPSNGRDPGSIVAFGEPTGGQDWPAILPDSNYTLEKCRANAARIVTCWNAHDDLLAAIQNIHQNLNGDVCLTSSQMEFKLRVIRDRTRAAIVKEEGDDR